MLRDVRGRDDLAAVAHRLLLGVGTPYDVSGQTLTVTCSIGIARGMASREAEELLAAADVAMYGAKRNGKNAFRIVG